MSDEPANTSAPSSSQTTMRFSYRSVWDHARCLLSYPTALFVTPVAVFGVLWGVAEASGYFLDVDLRGWQFYAGAILVSVVAAVGRGLYVHLDGCPDGFESESRAARRIGQAQRPLWEFRLARQLLEDKLRQLDNELTALLEGRVFVAIESRLGLMEYLEWAKVRPENVLRMVEVAKRLLITDFPASVESREGRAAEPASILSAVNQIRDLYTETVAFERGNHAVAPSEALESLHALQCGWTNPIRNAVQQMFSFLDQMLSLDTKSDHSVSFTIEFEEPPNVERYCEELDRLTSQLPGIMYDEMTS